MKLLSVSLGSNREIEIIGNVDVPNRHINFQIVANGLIICEDDSYDGLREIVMEIVALNQGKKEGMN
jgi:hypothetical protein